MRRAATELLQSAPHWAETLINSVGTKAVLSVLILVSVLPVQLSASVRLAFLVVFSVEVALRAWLLARRWSTTPRSERVGQIGLLCLDGLATLSFAPGVSARATAGQLRLLRLIRMALLVSYWWPFMRDFLRIALRQERLQQLGLVVLFAGLLAGTGAASVRLFDIRGLDLDRDGVVDEPEDREIGGLLWWCLRQIEDPGNLVDNANEGPLAALSLALTTGGLLLMALLIGQGANLVTEMVAASRLRRVPLFRHVVVVNASKRTVGVLTEMGHYYRKQLRRARFAVLVDSDERPDFLDTVDLRSLRFVPGAATDLDSLRRAAVDQARRVVVLHPSGGERGDAQVVAATLGILECAPPEATVALEVENVATGALVRRLAPDRAHHVVPIRARHLAACLLARAVTEQRSAPVFAELLSAEGHELYSAVFDEGDLAGLPRLVEFRCRPGELVRWAYEQHQVVVVGFLRGESSETALRVELVADRDCREPLGAVRGIVGVADRFQSLAVAARAAALHADRLGDAVESVAGPLAGWLDFRPPDLPLVYVRGRVEAALDLVAAWCDLPLRPGHIVYELPEPEDAARFGRGLLELPGESIQSDGVRTWCARPRRGDAFRITAVDAGLANGVRDRAAVCVLLPHDGADPDARTVLALLRTEMGEAGCGQRIVADFADTDTLALWQERTHPAEWPVTLLSTERLREQILAQCFFVRWLPEIYEALLTAARTGVACLRSPAPRTFGQAVREAAAHGVVALATSRADGGMVVVPPPDESLGENLYCVVPHAIGTTEPTPGTE